jgi:hypothetical protein
MDIQRIYKTHQECFKFLIFLQVECAVTPETGLSATELKEVIDGIMPHELIAHTWRSAFYYRFVFAA